MPLSLLNHSALASFAHNFHLFITFEASILDAASTAQIGRAHV